MSWIKYLLEANLYLTLFYAAYYLLMRRETYYQLNRVYLLSSSAFAFIIPLLQLGFLKRQPEQVQASFNSFDTTLTTHITSQPVVQISMGNIDSTNYYLIVYLTIALLLAIGFGFRLLQLIRLAKRGKRHAAPEFMLIEIDEDDRAFSFFNYLFIGKKLSDSATVIQHELVHIRQRHSLDIIYLELLKIVCWFNPVLYLLQHSIKEIHEFIADSHIATSQQDVDDYTDFLIGNAYGLSDTALTNNFFNNKLLKTRIMMLHQKKSGGLARLKYLVTLPLLAGMLCLSTLGFTKNYMVIDLAPGHNDEITKTELTKMAAAAPTTSAMAQQIPPKPKVEELHVATPPKPKVEELQVATPPKPKVKIKRFPPAIKPKVEELQVATPPKAKVEVLPIATPPKPKLNKVQSLTPPKPKVDARPSTPLSNIAHPLDMFYSQLIQQVRYPAPAREKHIQGRVFASFDVDNNHKIQNITIVSSPDNDLSNEVTRVLTNSKPVISIKQGVTYTLPISFTLASNNWDKKADSPVPNTKTNDAAGPHHDERIDLNEISITALASN